ncbi:2S albumin [Apostasia shenzhenica]|uniref:2S albumin n=1 Tax=Apostasia shenzhenica TaxID=1088818 RepID=A0A2H9ZQU2_9ASPA|nr:2S albumin [Apostasia shenzhenica]
MTPKLASLAAVVLVLAAAAVAVAGANAATFRTRITKIEEIEPMVLTKEMCEQEMQRHSIDSCRHFLKYGSHGGHGMLARPAGNPHGSVPEECCEQIRQVSGPCRCDMVEMTLKEMMEEQGGGGGGMGQCQGRCADMMLRGAYLPTMCGAGSLCQFGPGSGGY